jgi:SAM-dependent methyltransferase
LELGCGPGTNRAFFRQREYCGVDLDPRAIEAARQAFPDKFVLGDITSIDLAESRFDLVLLHSVLHHLDDDSVRRAGNNLSRNLSDHGKVFIVDAYQAESVSISRLLTSLDRGRFIRPWPVWRDLVEEFLTVESSQFFSLWLGPLRAYRMFMVVGHPKGGG